jgi:hypothetical protein
MGQIIQLTAWVWKGLVLKYESAGNGMVFVIDTVTEIQENASVPEEKFKVPDGVVIQ